MRRAVLAAIVAVGVGVPLAVGTAMASADDDRRVVRSGNSSVVATATSGSGSGSGFEIDIDPELDARFGPRPVNAVQAAQIVEQAFPGARVTEAELDEENGGPIWEMEFILNGREREVDVDAVTGDILRDDD
ncbi:PepSY domain-containing protein [Micromonospora sp. NBC_01813]|uniref:PepSY domain-containing protein n=1 Tax=Micromonospora sp. NBC_01813 TaxID=2975988 RepID=UPI002DD96750|nr:PepSY domain-containing protein [Micromonospora sp. NBC_01813]WSA06711.1 PepSY domain-containing protein [Micromonospora sp. NBC_01813]